MTVSLPALRKLLELTRSALLEKFQAEDRELYTKVQEVLHVKQLDELEDTFAKALAPIFHRQVTDAARALVNINEKAAATGAADGLLQNIFNPKDYDEEIVNAALPILAKSMAEAMTATLLSAGIDPRKSSGWRPKSFKHNPGSHDQMTHGRRQGASRVVPGAFDGEAHNPNGRDTSSQYRTGGNRWTDERHALHNEIIAEALSKATPVDNPTSTLMGGGPASGKSMMMENSGALDNAVHIDPDEIKKSLPEYKVLMEQGDPEAAAFVHVESREISKRMLRYAAEGSYNVVLDGTGNGSIHSLSTKVSTMKKNGGPVEARYVTTDVETAVARNKARAEATGRMVPESFVRWSHGEVTRTAVKALKKGLFDDFTLHDTTKGSPTLVASAKGTMLTVHDKDLWLAFLKKGGSSVFAVPKKEALA